MQQKKVFICDFIDFGNFSRKVLYKDLNFLVKMKIELIKKPKNVTIIEGFPGYGLVSTITTEFLLDHIDDIEKIGRIWLPEAPAMIAVHKGKVVEPFGIFYSKKYNLVIIHVVTTVFGFEWEMAEAVMELAKQLNAKEIISVEGISSADIGEKPRAFYFSTNAARLKKLSKIADAPLQEGIIVGVTGIMMLMGDRKIPVTAIFAEAHSELPDSKAAARIIEVLNEYVGLDIDPKPLLKQAEMFEKKLQQLLAQTKKMMEEQKKKLSYVG